jgi:hypothetical protein
MPNLGIRIMNKPTIISLSLLAITLSVTTIQAKIYKWTDANGSVHYSATPPKLNKKSKLDVKDIEDKIRYAAGKPRVSTSKKTIEGPVSKDTNKKDEDKLSPPSSKLIKYCKSQRSNLKQLKENFNTTWVSASGKKALLTQTERKNKVKDIRKKISTECVGV